MEATVNKESGVDKETEEINDGQQKDVPNECNEVASILAKVDGLLIDHVLAAALEEKAQITEHMVRNGTTRVHLSNILFDLIEEEDNGDENSSESSNNSIGDDQEIEDEDQFMNDILIGKIDPDVIMAADEEESSVRCWSRMDPTSN